MEATKDNGRDRDKTFTETEWKILQLLSDGQAHSRRDIHACLPDELSDLTAIRAHISNIRKKIADKGQDIICVLRDRTIFYQHVRLLASANDGRV